MSKILRRIASKKRMLERKIRGKESKIGSALVWLPDDSAHTVSHDLYLNMIGRKHDWSSLTESFINFMMASF